MRLRGLIGVVSAVAVLAAAEMSAIAALGAHLFRSRTPTIQQMYGRERAGEGVVRLDGFVVDEAGKPVAGAQVQAIVTRANWMFQFGREPLTEVVTLNLATDAHGFFKVGPTRGSALRIRKVSRPGHRWLTVEGPDDNREYRFRPPGKGGYVYHRARPAFFPLPRERARTTLVPRRGGVEPWDPPLPADP